jgi:hypothetical protein
VRAAVEYNHHAPGISDGEEMVDHELLRQHHCFEAVDRVPRDPETTAFRRMARLQQALWREAAGYPIGSHPYRPKDGALGRPVGSRLAWDFAERTEANFMTEAAREAARTRVENPEPKQTLDRYRLYADLLSSMPMCFNLFGALAADCSLATRAVKTWWPDAPGRVHKVRFEWSPGRQLPGQYLENRSAFDVAFELALPDGTYGVIGVETKYHEHCKREKVPSETRMHRYRDVSERSGVFHAGACEAMAGTAAQQLWLDHLLGLSMLQHGSGRWTWCRFVLVHPAGNRSFEQGAEDYRSHLSDDASFDVRTVESLLDAGVLPPRDAEVFRRRYLW